MTLIGAINSGYKKIIFADRLWNLNGKSKEESKIFVNKDEKHYLIVSGIILRNLKEDFIQADIKKEKDLEKLIDLSYKDSNIPGTSFISYNFDEDRLSAYFLDTRVIKIPVVNYLFLGVDARNLKNFDYRDVDHTLISALREHKSRYPDLIGKKIDSIYFQNKLAIWRVINL